VSLPSELAVVLLVVLLPLAGLACLAMGWRMRAAQQDRRVLETRLAQRNRALSFLNEIATIASRLSDVNEILDEALARTLQVMEVEAGGIYLLDEVTDRLQLAAHRGLSDALVAEVQDLAVGEGFSGRVVQSGRPMVVPDVAQDPRLTRSRVREEGLRSLAVVSLTVKGRSLGTLFTVTKHRRGFAVRDVNLLTSIAHQIAGAIENSRLLSAVQRRAEQFRLLNEIDRVIASILSLDELLTRVAALIQESFGYYLVEIGLVEGNELAFRAGAGGEWGPGFVPFRIAVGHQGVTGWVAATGETLLVPDVSQDPRYVAIASTKTRSELALPIRTKDAVIGVINVESDRPLAFDETDVVVLQSLASQAAIAIQNARFFEAERRRAEQFRVLAEVGRRMTLTLDLDEVLLQVAQLVQQSFGYYHVGIGLIEDDEVVYRVGAGELWDSPGFAFKPARLKVGSEGLTGSAAAHMEPLIVGDVSADPRYVWMEGSVTRSEAVFPVIVKGQVIGVLDVQSDRREAFDQTDVSVLESIAHQAAAAIENARLYEASRQAAVVEERQRIARELHDAVTQTLFSASLIAQALPAIWQRDQQEGTQLLGELRQLSRGALAEMRTLLLELRPASLTEAKLEDLLRQLSEAASGREGLPVHVHADGSGWLPPDVHVAFYRIAQEALNNIVKHARASRADVELHLLPSGDAQLCIRDDGRGFTAEDVQAGELGLSIMRERADAVGADLTIDSTAGQGTQVRVAWKGPPPGP
jgi:signal transduction histidine kinase